jgi:hypothetical protein
VVEEGASELASAFASKLAMDKEEGMKGKWEGEEREETNSSIALS